MPASIGFYPEKACAKLEAFAQKGWRLEKFRYGFCILKKGEPQKLRYAIDFYSGKKKDTADYLELYEASGWTKAAAYRKRYYFFKAALKTPMIYSDEATYQTRIRKEWLWLLLNSFWLVPIGGMLLAAWYFIKSFFQIQLDDSFIQGLLTGVFLLFPIAMGISIVYFTVMYRQRKKYYSQPEKMATSQRVIRDSIALAFAGGIVGALIGFFISNIK